MKCFSPANEHESRILERRIFGEKRQNNKYISHKWQSRRKRLIFEWEKSKRFNYNVVKEQQLVADLPNNAYSIKLPPNRIYIFLHATNCCAFYACTEYWLDFGEWVTFR